MLVIRSSPIPSPPFVRGGGGEPSTNTTDERRDNAFGEHYLSLHLGSSKSSPRIVFFPPLLILLTLKFNASEGALLAGVGRYFGLCAFWFIPNNEQQQWPSDLRTPHCAFRFFGAGLCLPWLRGRHRPPVPVLTRRFPREGES